MSIVFYVHNKNKIDTAKLRKIASEFGISDIWLDIEAYVRRKTLKNENLFLPWEEFLSKAKLYDIDPEKYLLPQSHPSLFSDINEYLTKPMNIFVLGGENMRIKKLKAVTKDCDVVVESIEDFEILSDVLIKKLGYARTIKTQYSQEDLRLYPDDILIHPNRSRIDLFTKRIMKDLSLSDVMVRTADYIDYGKLRVGILRNEFVFLLKAVASREGDIQDMDILAQGSLNQPSQFDHGKFEWDEVWREIIHQERMNPIRNFTFFIFEQITLLAEQTGIIAPIFDRLRRHVLHQVIMRIICGGRQPLKEVVSNLVGGDISEQMIRNRIDALVRESEIKKQVVKKEVYVSPTPVPLFPHKEWELSVKNVEDYLDWRFHMRPPSTHLTIERFIDEVVDIGHNSIGVIDDIVVKHLDQLLDYEQEYFPESLRRVGAVRVCIGLSDPKLGNNGKSNFYIKNFKKFSKPKEAQLISTVHDGRQNV